MSVHNRVWLKNCDLYSIYVQPSYGYIISPYNTNIVELIVNEELGIDVHAVKSISGIPLDLLDKMRDEINNGLIYMSKVKMMGYPDSVLNPKPLISLNDIRKFCLYRDIDGKAVLTLGNFNAIEFTGDTCIKDFYVNLDAVHIDLDCWFWEQTDDSCFSFTEGINVSPAGKDINSIYINGRKILVPNFNKNGEGSLI